MLKFVQTSTSLNAHIHIFCAEKAVYIGRTNHNCLGNNSLHSIESDGTPYHENCKDWCDIMNYCGAFAVFRKTCYFKKYDCFERQQKVTGSHLFFKKG